MEIECRICDKNVIINKIKNYTQCSCRGTMKYVHDECLSQFFEHTGNYGRNINCNVCNKQFIFSEYIIIRRFLKFYKSKEECDIAKNYSIRRLRGNDTDIVWNII